MWDLLPSDDERMIAESVRDVLAAELPLSRLRAGAQPTDARPAMAELGWFGVGLPEVSGGAGMGLVAEALVQRECGRHLASPSVLATVLAGHMAALAGRGAVDGSDVSHWLPAALAIDAAPESQGNSRSVLVFDWNAADSLLFWNEAGMGLFAPEALSAACEEQCFDDSVSLLSARLSPAEAQLWVPAETAPLAARAQLLLAAAMVGLAEQACDLAVEYAKVREQFGKPIGSFQAVKHRCADMAVRQRLAWYQTGLACLKLEAGADDAALQVASAKLLAAEAAHENGRACVQIHGGIGFQAECDVHWFLKRARLYDQAGGDIERQASIVIQAPAPDW